VGSRRVGSRTGIQTPDAPQVRSNENGLLSIQTSGIGAAKDGNGKPPAIFSISPCPTGLGRQEYRTFVGAQDQPGTAIMRKNSENILHVWKFCLPLHHDNTGKKYFRPQLSGWCHSSVGRAKD